MSIIIWIIIIAVIITYSKNQKAKQEKTNQEYAKKFSTNAGLQKKDSANSYYSQEKRTHYQKMEKDHSEHNQEKEEKDLSDTIGYKKCPNCGSTVSSKSDTCFMCDYEFEQDHKI